MKKLHKALTSFPWRRVFALLCGGLICVTLWAEAEQTELAGKVIRLHVLANSDSQADQDLKLQVRDRILEKTAELLDGQESAPSAEAILSDNLQLLAQSAYDEIADQGYDYPVRVSLEDTWFPTRQYENVSLPAGTYRALRVVIGEGEGHNWWCVLFPSLCLSAVTETSVTAAGLSGQDYALLTGESQPYVVKFKAVELWGNCKHWLKG